MYMYGWVPCCPPETITTLVTGYIVVFQLLNHVQLCDPMDCSPTGFSAHRDFSRQEYWSGLPFPSPGVKHLLLGRKAMTNLDSVFKKARHHFAYKGSSSQSYGFSSSYVWMWELDHKEDWALKNWCFQTVMLGRLLRMPWTASSNQSV